MAYPTMVAKGRSAEPHPGPCEAVCTYPFFTQRTSEVRSIVWKVTPVTSRAPLVPPSHSMIMGIRAKMATSSFGLARMTISWLSPTMHAAAPVALARQQRRLAHE
jgi:hypothetical protein